MGLLRLLLSFSVLSAHAGPIGGLTFVGGKIAVQAFFLLSGFYMAFILNEKYLGRKNAYKLFITNRILRIYPTYWAVLLITILASLILFSINAENKFSIYEDNNILFHFFPLIYLLFSHFFIIGQDLVMFMGIDPAKGSLFFTHDYLITNPLLHNFSFIPQAWTISLELLFYCIAPFLVRRHIGILLLLIILSIFFRLYLYSIGLHREPWTNRFFFTELVFFLLGILSYRVYTYIHTKRIPFIPLLCFFILIVITMSYNILPTQTKLINVTQLSYFGLLFAGIPFIFSLTKLSSFDRFLGILSYPVYLSHALVIDILQRLIPVSNLFGIQTVIVTLCIAIILVYLIEKPLDYYRQKRIKKIRVKK